MEGRKEAEREGPCSLRTVLYCTVFVFSKRRLASLHLRGGAGRGGSALARAWQDVLVLFHFLFCCLGLLALHHHLISPLLPPHPPIVSWLYRYPYGLASVT